MDVDSLRRLLDSYPDGPLCERFHVSLSGVFEKIFFLKYDGLAAVDILFAVLSVVTDSGHRRSWRASAGAAARCRCASLRFGCLVGNALAYFCGRDPLDVVGLAAFLDALPSASPGG